MRLDSLRRSTPFRLALTFGLLFIVTFFVSGAIAYHSLRLGLARQLDESLSETYSVVSSTYAPDDLEDLITTLNTYARLRSTEHGLYSLVDGKGKRLAGNFIAPLMPDGVFTVEPSDIGLKGNGTYRIRSAKLGPDTLVVGKSFAEMDRLLKIVLFSLGWAAVLVIAAAAAGGIFLAARAQQRLDSVARTMLDVSHGRLATRIPLKGTNDDIDVVAAQINDALNQLSGLVEGMRQVSADIAHELKTPLNRLKMTLDDAMSSHEKGLEIRGLLTEARSESDQINATFEALLRISQIEAGARKRRFQQVDLADVLGLVNEVYADVADDNGQRLIFEKSTGAFVRGDKELLTQMVVNLVENAIAHCPSGTTIQLGLSATGSSVAVTVADNGPGIPKTERQKVFQRLYRLDKSRTTPGSGLGLSLVKAIADLHDAQISVSDNNPGLSIMIMIASANPGEER